MDRFKFMFWDEEDNKMYAVNHIHGLNNPLPSHGLSQTAVVVDCSGPGQSGMLQISVENRDHLLQCTGRKDKNKKLIFDGHIIQTGVGEIGVVVFNYQDARFCVAFKSKHMTAYCGFVPTYEIIGHALKNPELLEAQSER